MATQPAHEEGSGVGDTQCQPKHAQYGKPLLPRLIRREAHIRPASSLLFGTENMVETEVNHIHAGKSPKPPRRKGALENRHRRRKKRRPPRVSAVATNHHIRVHTPTTGLYLAAKTAAETSTRVRIAPGSSEGEAREGVRHVVVPTDNV